LDEYDPDILLFFSKLWLLNPPKLYPLLWFTSGKWNLFADSSE
jgi:hypothetical protein